MRTLIRVALAAALLAGGLLVPAVLGPATAASAAAGSSSGGCSYQLINGAYQFVCTHTSSTGGAPGTGGGSGGKSACTLTPLSQQQVSFLGLQWPPPKNHAWDAITCPGNQAFGGVILVDVATGVPPVTPAELAQIAIGDLVIPELQPHTAPPLHDDGLVGLPEWFWIPAGWGAQKTRRITAGPVWAQAIAVPTKIIFNPGGGLAGVTCQGPGTVYHSSVPLSAQHTDCSYTYDQPSTGQPGNAYAASVTVLWNVTWVGSGGAGGTVAIGRAVSTPVPVTVAAGEALVTGG
jgi:hypothetical protein